MTGSPAAADTFGLSPEHAEQRAAVERFARTEVAPVIGDLYERGEFPYDLVAKMGSMGLFGLPFPEEVGGMGGDELAFCLALEELARVDSSVAITLEAGGRAAGGGAPFRRGEGRRLRIRTDTRSPLVVW